MDILAKLKNKNLLVAEDEIINYIYIKEILEEIKVNLFHVKNGKLAVEKMNSSIDMVLMDLKMPEMTGYEATEIIKQKYPNVPIIALTAFAYQNEIEKALESGCSGYLIKPFKTDKFLELISDWL